MAHRKVNFDVVMKCANCGESVRVEICYPQLSETEDQFQGLIEQFCAEQDCENCVDGEMLLIDFEPFQYRE